MEPQLHLNYPAIVAAVVASFLFGWLWHGPIAGKKWAALMKFPADFKPDQKMVMKSMALTLLGTLLTAFIRA